jgi:hypothetical protein
MPRPYGEVMYTLSGIIIARYNIVANTFGTPVVVDDGQMAVFEPEADTDKMRGYGQHTRGLTVPIGSKVTLKAGGIDYSAYEVMSGATITDSGSTPNQVRTVDTLAGGAGLPYFGVIGVGETDDGGKFVCGHKAIKLDTIPKREFNGETNKFMLWETAGYSFPQNNKIDRIKVYESAAGWVVPTTGAEFLAFFA